ncbi:MAG: hypothetical protein PHU81_08330 [Acidobacteriota bacterium]|nr:hypothetical protein [Acidobacteriota bacterium]
MKKAVILSTVMVFLIGTFFIYVSAQTKTQETTTKVDQKSAPANPASCTNDKACCCCSGGCRSGQHQMAAKSAEDRAKMKAEMSQAECNQKHMAMTGARTEMAAKTCSQATGTTAQEAHQGCLDAKAASQGQQANTKAQAMNCSHQEMMTKMAEGKSATTEADCAMMHQKTMESTSKTEPGVQATGQASIMKKGCCCQKMAGSSGCGHMIKTEENKETVTKTEVKTK